MDVYFRNDQRICSVTYTLRISNDSTYRKFLYKGFKTQGLGKWALVWHFHHCHLCRTRAVDHHRQSGAAEIARKGSSRFKSSKFKDLKMRLNVPTLNLEL